MRRVARLLLPALLLACGPPGGGGGTVAPHLPGEGKDGDGKQPPEAKDPWAGRKGMIAPPARLAAAPVELPAVRRFTLSNGLRVVVAERHDLPAVSMQLAIRVGRAHAPRDKMGVEQLTAALLEQGTRSRTASAIHDELDRVGASIQAQASFENTLLSCATVRAQLDTCMKLLPDLIASPAFTEGAFTIARADLRGNALRRASDPGQLAALHFQNLLWGEDHVRGWAMSLATVDAISRADVVAWHGRWFKPNNAVLAIAGDVDGKALEAQLGKAFAGWKKGAVPASPQFKVKTRGAPVARVVDWRHLPQAHIRVGHTGIAHRDADFEATMVFTQVLSDRLQRRLDKEPGKGAAGSAGFDRNLDTGIYVVSGISRPADAMAVVRTALQEMTELTDKGPSKAEVDAAVMATVGRYAGRFETVADLANELLAAELHGVDDAGVRNYPTAIAAVTPESARAAAGRVLEPEAPVVVIVGDGDVIAQQLEAVGVAYDRINADEPVGSYEREPEPADPKQADALGRKILGKALAAKGGAARLRAVKNMTLTGKAKGTVDGQGFAAEIKRTYVAPDKVRRDLSRMAKEGKITSAVVLAGGEGWADESMGGEQRAGELPAPFVTALQAQLWRDPDLVLLRYLDKGVKVEGLPGRVVQGSPCNVVRITRGDGVSATLYLDAKTNLLRQMMYRSEGSRAVESYGEYRPLNGVQVAYRRITVEGATTFDLTLDKAEINGQVPANAFEKPKK